MEQQGKLSERQFDKFRGLIKDKLGIELNDAKKDMIDTKVARLMREENISSSDEYYNMLVTAKGAVWQRFVDLITIHKTNFFREDNHFVFLREKIQNILRLNKRIDETGEIRVWSSACSTGNEPYTIAMVLKECLPPNIQSKILATDVSSGVISKALKGEYVLDNEDLINNYYLNKYFVRNGGSYNVIPEIKHLVTFRAFNLMDTFPFRDKFDIIFCRNVMIYFPPDRIEILIKKFYEALTPGGMLFIGHSESLIHKQYNFRYVQPTIYMRPE
jgi:chemotaxis protein methyltransferase CheR